MPLQTPLNTEDQLYTAWQDRLAFKSTGIQAGVVEVNDYKVNAGAGLQVEVEKGNAWVMQTGATQESSNAFFDGLYQVSSSTKINPSNSVVVSSVNPQIAQIILRVYDINELKISGSSYAKVEWLNGTPTIGATLENRSGAAALPQSSLRLADVLVPKNAASSAAYEIRDRRLWANGGYAFQTVSPGNLTLSEKGAWKVIDSAAWQMRMECGGGAIRLSFTGASAQIYGSGVVWGNFFIDGAPQEFATVIQNSGASEIVEGSFAFETTKVVTAGTHLFSPGWQQTGTKALLLGNTGYWINTFQIQEVISQESNNGTK